MKSKKKKKAKLYTRYPLSSILIYNGSTILHFLLGGFGIILGYNFSSWAGYTFGCLYLVFAFLEMYVLMPLSALPVAALIAVSVASVPKDLIVSGPSFEM